MPSESIIQVALPVPLPGCFDYRLPAGSPTPPRGARVQVPFGRRTLVGLVHGHQPSQFAKLKNVQRVLDQEAVIDEALKHGLATKLTRKEVPTHEALDALVHRKMYNPVYVPLVDKRRQA